MLSPPLFCIQLLVCRAAVQVFAYGQTGSGKTYTMGSAFEIGTATHGIIPLAMDTLYNRISVTPNADITVRVSFVEIHQVRSGDRDFWGFADHRSLLPSLYPPGPSAVSVQPITWSSHEMPAVPFIRVAGRDQRSFGSHRCARHGSVHP